MQKKIKHINVGYPKDVALFIVSYLIVVFFCCCKKMVEVKAPVTSVNENNVYSNDASAAASLTGNYIAMSDGSSIFTGRSGVSLLAGLSADEFTLYKDVTDSKLIAYYKNALSVSQTIGSEFWAPLYNFVYNSNIAIEKLNDAASLTPSVRQQLLGEAKFLRAFYYFYLTNLFGDVPLALTSDYKVNSSLPNSKSENVYKQIVDDLKDAQNLLSDTYLSGDVKSITTERVRPTKWAATALLARAYLYMKEFANAEVEATKVIDNSSVFNLTSLDSTFLKNSHEAIWQLQPVNVGHNTEDGWLFVIPSTGFIGDTYPVYLDTNLVNRFDSVDNRRRKWMNKYINFPDSFYFPYKYKSAELDAPVTEYLMVFRLAEQFLIRAEARAELNKLNAAQLDLNSIRNRAGLGSISLTDKVSAISAVLNERRLELFSEWGHRWLDIKRREIVDQVMGVNGASFRKGGSWSSYKMLYPIPLIDIQRDVNLVQNAGY